MIDANRKRRQNFEIGSQNSGRLPHGEADSQMVIKYEKKKQIEN